MNVHKLSETELLILFSTLIHNLDPGEALELAVEAALKYQGLTIDILAEEQEITPRYVSLLLRGQRGKRGKALKKLAEIREFVAPLEITRQGAVS